MLRGDDWALVMARRDTSWPVPLSLRDADLIAARAELERERRKRREVENRLALFDPVFEMTLEARR